MVPGLEIRDLWLGEGMVLRYLANSKLQEIGRSVKSWGDVLSVKKAVSVKPLASYDPRNTI